MDEFFAVHPKMRLHSGEGLSLGCGFTIVRSTKQRLNTKISTETEIVGVDNFMPEICWTRYFISAQGYNDKDNHLHQDNKSSILMGNIGKALIRNRTKHINIWYFIITNGFKKSEVSLLQCPKGDMIGDYMYKLLQGAMLQNFRDQIMGVIPDVDASPREVKEEELRKL